MEQSFGGMKKEIEKFFEDGSLGLTAKSVTKTSLWLEVHNRRREQSDCDGSSGNPEQSEQVSSQLSSSEVPPFT